MTKSEWFKLRWARFFTLAGWDWRLADRPDFDFIVTFPCGHSACSGSHTLIVRVWERRHEILARRHEELFSAEQMWATPSPALFGDGPKNTHWQMVHGSGGGCEIASEWVDNANQLWERTARESTSPDKEESMAQAKIYEAFCQASSKPVDGWFIYSYTYDDEQLGWMPVEEFKRSLRDREGEYFEGRFGDELSDDAIKQLKSAMKRDGWEGDGTLCGMMVPPFFSGDSEDGYWFPVFHVKQSNNGFSYIAARRPLDTLGLHGNLMHGKVLISL